MIRLRFTLIAAVLGLALLVPGSARAAPRGLPEVICVVNPAVPSGAYRYRPHRCDLHVRDVFPVAHYNTLITRGLRWRSWGRLSAFAVGRVGVSTVGWQPLRLRLTRPRRWFDGPLVFTVASGRFKYRGSWRYFSNPIDNYLLRGWLII
jgi:hypothetical protein